MEKAVKQVSASLVARVYIVCPTCGESIEIKLEGLSNYRTSLGVDKSRVRIGWIPAWLQEFEKEAGYNKTWRGKMIVGISIGFLKWKRDFFWGNGLGLHRKWKFTILQLSGTVLGAEVSIFFKVG